MERNNGYANGMTGLQRLPRIRYKNDLCALLDDKRQCLHTYAHTHNCGIYMALVCMFVNMSPLCSIFFADATPTT